MLEDLVLGVLTEANKPKKVAEAKNPLATKAWSIMSDLDDMLEELDEIAEKAGKGSHPGCRNAISQVQKASGALDAFANSLK